MVFFGRANKGLRNCQIPSQNHRKITLLKQAVNHAEMSKTFFIFFKRKIFVSSFKNALTCYVESLRDLEKNCVELRAKCRFQGHKLHIRDLAQGHHVAGNF